MKIFSFLFFVFSTTVITACLNMGWCSKYEMCQAETPSLSGIILFASQPVKTLNLDHYHGDAQECIRKYLGSIGSDSYLWQFEVPSNPEKVSIVRRRVLLEHMVTVIGEEARTEAQTFANAIPLVIEWEGQSEGPVQEADFIDQWLRNHPGTALAPFLHLLKAHRLRAGYEAAHARDEKGLLPILARRYHEALKEIKSSTNFLISCIAADLETLDFVYLEGQGRP